MIEIMNSQAWWIYRHKPGDPAIIEVRRNKRGGRWHVYKVCASADEAQVELMRLARAIRGEDELPN